MMQFACCHIAMDQRRQRFLIKPVAFFQYEKDAEIFSNAVRSTPGEPNVFIVDVMAGRIMKERSYCARDFMDMGMSYQEAYSMFSACVRRDIAVENYFKGWRKRNGVGDRAKRK